MRTGPCPLALAVSDVERAHRNISTAVRVTLVIPDRDWTLFLSLHPILDPLAVAGELQAQIVTSAIFD